MFQGCCRLKKADAQMKIIEILPDCGRDPMWVAAVPSSDQPGLMRIVVSDDEPPFDAPRYVLEVSCRKADVNLVSKLYRLHRGTNTQPGCKPFDEDWESSCVKGKRCPLRDLSVEEAFFPLVIDELYSEKPRSNSHWDDK